MDIRKGSLTIVGTGISVSGQLTLVAKKHIQQADVVFTAIPNQPGFEYVKSLNPNTRSLTNLYEIDKPRAITYKQMAKRIVDQVYAGHKVCAAFYGHPGVFVNPSHAALNELQKQGFSVHMVPGISAEDCLFADLGLDPATHGCQSYEANKFLLRRYAIDPHMTQILWQVALAGDYSFSTKFIYDGKGIELLLAKLINFYPEDHEVIIYEASTNPLFTPRIEKLPLKRIVNAVLTPISTLVIPSLGTPHYDENVFQALGISLETAERNSQLS